MFQYSTWGSSQQPVTGRGPSAEACFPGSRWRRASARNNQGEGLQPHETNIGYRRTITITYIYVYLYIYIQISPVLPHAIITPNITI